MNKLHSQYERANSYWILHSLGIRGVGSGVTFLFLTKTKSQLSTCYKGTCPYKDYTNAIRKVQSYNMIDISWESKERGKKKKTPQHLTVLCFKNHLEWNASRWRITIVQPQTCTWKVKFPVIDTKILPLKVLFFQIQS